MKGLDKIVEGMIPYQEELECATEAEQSPSEINR